MTSRCKRDGRYMGEACASCEARKAVVDELLRKVYPARILAYVIYGSQK